MTHQSSYGVSPAAHMLERAQHAIAEHQRASLTFSRQTSIDAIFAAMREADEDWKVGEGESAISDEVMETACQFIAALPIGLPQPSVAGEPDGHISLEWYRSPRRILTVSLGPNGRLHWAALIGSEDPRGSAVFLERIPRSLLYYISRVCEND